MDPDSTAFDFDTEILEKPLPGDDFNSGADFLEEFFRLGEDNLVIVDATPSVTNMAHEEMNHLPSGKFSQKDTENGNLVNDNVTILEEIRTENEFLKQEIKELKKQNIMLESQLANYEGRLSQKMQEALSTKMENDCIVECSKKKEQENTALKLKLAQLEAEVYQYRELSLKYANESRDKIDLQKEITLKKKRLQKFKSDIDVANGVLSERNLQLNKMKQKNKRLWNLLSKFGEKLSIAGLLTQKEKSVISREYDEDNPFTEDMIEDNMEEKNHNTSLESSQMNPGSDIFLMSEKTPTVSSSAKPRIVPTSNYFLKSVQEVIEDSNVSDLDGFVTELEEIRKQVCMQSNNFVPISPLPRTPPPKYAHLLGKKPFGTNNSQTMDTHKAICNTEPEFLHSETALKKRPFIHQKSEGFDVPVDTESESFNSAKSLALNSSSNSADKKKYGLYLKRSLDGNIKLDVDNPAPLYVEFDLETENLSLTFMRHESNSSVNELKSANLDNASESYGNTSTNLHKKPRLSVDNSASTEPSISAFNKEKSKLSVEEEVYKTSNLGKRAVDESNLLSHANAKVDNGPVVTSSCESSPSKRSIFLSRNKLNLMPVSSSRSRQKSKKLYDPYYKSTAQGFGSSVQKMNYFKQTLLESYHDASYSSSESDTQSTDIHRSLTSLKTTPRQRKKRTKSAISNKAPASAHVKVAQAKAKTKEKVTGVKKDTNELNSEMDSTKTAIKKPQGPAETSSGSSLSLKPVILATETLAGGEPTELECSGKRDKPSMSQQAQSEAHIVSPSIAEISADCSKTKVSDLDKSCSAQRQLSFNAQDSSLESEVGSGEITYAPQNIIVTQPNSLENQREKSTRKRVIVKQENVKDSNQDMPDILTKAKRRISGTVKVKTEKDDTGIKDTTGIQNGISARAVNSNVITQTNGHISERDAAAVNSHLSKEECGKTALSSKAGESSIPMSKPNKRGRKPKVKKETKDDYESNLNAVKPSKDKIVEAATDICALLEMKKLICKVKIEKLPQNILPSLHKPVDSAVTENCYKNSLSPLKNGPSTGVSHVKKECNSSKVKSSIASFSLEKGDTDDFSQIDVGSFNPGAFISPVCFDSPFKEFKTDSPASPPPETYIEYRNTEAGEVIENETTEDFFNSLQLSPKKSIPISPTSFNLSNNNASRNLLVEVHPEFGGVEVEVETEKSKRKGSKPREKKGFLVEDTMEAELAKKDNSAVLTNGDTANGDSKISELDSDSDHPLFIVDNVPDVPKVDSDIDHSEDASFNETITVRKVGKKKRKSCNWSIKKTQKKESPEAGVNSILAAFNTLEKMQFTDQHFKLNVHNLVTVLINPANIESLKKLTFYVIGHLCDSRKNPLLSFSQSGDPATLLPLTENCIVTALFEIEKRDKPCLMGLIDCVVKNLTDMIVGKAIFTIYGQSSLCRVLAEICKRRNDKRTLYVVLSDLIRRRQKFTPFFITSMVGIWNDLLQPLENSGEERVFFSAIAYALHNKLGTLTDTHWKLCKNVLNKYLTVKKTQHLLQDIEFLTETIQAKCFKDEYENAFMLITPLAIFAQVQGWAWATKNILHTFVLPCMQHLVTEKWNRVAFRVCCDIYAEVSVICPSQQQAYEVFNHLFEHPDHQDDVVHFHVALALLKLYTIRMEFLPHGLVEWASASKLGKDPDPQVKELETLFQRRNIHSTIFNKNEIIVPSNEKNAGHKSD